MKQTIIIDNERYQVTSLGNGWAYSVERKEDGHKLWMQDEDATQFSNELENTHDRWSYNDVIDQYSELFAPG